MDGPQIRLKLVLDKLGIPSNVSTLENRICIQKAIFLAKCAGADLGYSYNWYIHGPYSPELTSDYYLMDNDLSCGDPDYQKYELVPSLDPNLERAKNIMEKPSGVDLSKTEWLELVSSIIYWQKSTGNKTETKSILKSEKNALFKDFDTAFERINECGLLPS
jgi:uncharacterized protein YwgA